MRTLLPTLHTGLLTAIVFIVFFGAQALSEAVASEELSAREKREVCVNVEGFAGDIISSRLSGTSLSTVLDKIVYGGIDLNKLNDTEQWAFKVLEKISLDIYDYPLLLLEEPLYRNDYLSDVYRECLGMFNYY